MLVTLKHVWHDTTDGYSMKDIIYKWAKGKESVGIQKNLELPQFRLLGHRQGAKNITLSTGEPALLMPHTVRPSTVITCVPASVACSLGQTLWSKSDTQRLLLSLASLSSARNSPVLLAQCGVRDSRGEDQSDLPVILRVSPCSRAFCPADSFLTQSLLLRSSCLFPSLFVFVRFSPDQPSFRGIASPSLSL